MIFTILYLLISLFGGETIVSAILLLFLIVDVASIEAVRSLIE